MKTLEFEEPPKQAIAKFLIAEYLKVETSKN